jgi:hypothetical protein
MEFVSLDYVVCRAQRATDRERALLPSTKEKQDMQTVLRQARILQETPLASR